MRAIRRRRAGALTGVAAVALLAGCADSSLSEVPALHPRIDELPQTIVEIDTSDDDVEVAALVAATPEQRQRGLQEVEDLPDGAGMLFLFDRDRTTGFWMKDTVIPLEIAFVAADGRVVEIFSMEPCEEEPCEIYAPEESYRAALEVSDGWLTEQGVRAGDRMSWGEVPAPR
jgi:uncharacterized protein